MISAEVIQWNSAINFKCQMVATPLQNIMPCFVASNPIDGGWSLAAATAGMVREGGLCVNVETKRNEVGFCEEMWVCGKLTGVPV